MTDRNGKVVSSHGVCGSRDRSVGHGCPLDRSVVGAFHRAHDHTCLDIFIQDIGETGYGSDAIGIDSFDRPAVVSIGKSSPSGIGSGELSYGLVCHSYPLGFILFLPTLQPVNHVTGQHSGRFASLADILRTWPSGLAAHSAFFHGARQCPERHGSRKLA